ncbi:MAG TPA: hypothetical protein VF806_07455 [Anaerolineaceae bacterium]
MEDNTPVPALPPPSGETTGGKAPDGKSAKAPVGLIIGAVVLILVVIAGAVLLLRSDNATTGRVRDIFIILMALESLVIGVALVILIIQLATLINLLQNELKPIIQSTNDTVNTLRGTVTFLSDNITEPVIKLNTYLAGIKQFFDLMRPGRSKH